MKNFNFYLFIIVIAFCFHNLTVRYKAFGQAQNSTTNSRDTIIIENEGTSRVLLRKDLSALPRKSIRAKDYKGVDTVTFEGVELHEVLRKVGIKLGKDLKHAELSKYLVAEAHDGYKIVFALAEIEPLFTNNIILLADTKNGKPLDDYAGAMCLIVPHEKKNGRWIRQLKSLTIKRG